MARKKAIVWNCEGAFEAPAVPGQGQLCRRGMPAAHSRDTASTRIGEKRKKRSAARAPAEGPAQPPSSKQRQTDAGATPGGLSTTAAPSAAVNAHTPAQALPSEATPTPASSLQPIAEAGTAAVNATNHAALATAADGAATLPLSAGAGGEAGGQTPEAGTGADAGAHAAGNAVGAVAAQPAASRVPVKAAPALPWMRVPVAIEAGGGVPLDRVKGLAPGLQDGLQAGGFAELFPVQAAVWRVLAGGHSAAHDLCLCAPTGSGKTLAYALPILQALSGRRVACLRALAVLPTRDLAQQVFDVFATLCPRLGLTTVLAAGKASQAVEAEALTGGSANPACWPLGAWAAAPRVTADVMVATPGRLVAHLQGTPGFCLQDLRFLVVDEADRLLRQAYQDWLPRVLAVLQPASLQQPFRRRCVKLVVSATLTRDPSKIERLLLHCPRYIALTAADHRYKLPRGLVEFKVLCPAELKPLVLLALLCELAGQATVVFTASVEASHRLHALLAAAQALLPERSVQFSSHLAPAARAAQLAAFRCGRAKVIVASDAMTRGMDVEGVENVVNYDAPVYPKTYVHRAGRTARAGRSGRVFTLLRSQDMRHFKAMLRKLDNTYVKDYAPAQQLLDSLRPGYEAALQHVQEDLDF